MADDALSLDLGADDETRDVLEKYQRDVERVAQPDEASGFVGGIDVERAALDDRLIRDDAGALAVEAHQRRDDVAGKRRLDLEHATFVGQSLDHQAHVVGGPRIRGHDLRDVVDPALTRIRCLPARRHLAIVRRHE